MLRRLLTFGMLVMVFVLFTAPSLRNVSRVCNNSSEKIKEDLA